MPYVLLAVLTLKLWSAGFKARVGGLRTLVGIRFAVIGRTVPVQISSVRLSYSQGKALITVTGVEVDLTAAGENVASHSSAPRGGLFALLIRILLLFIAQHVEVQVNHVVVYLRGVGLCAEDCRLRLQIDHTVRPTQNAESKISLLAAPVRVLLSHESEVRIGPVTVDLLLPTSVSLAQSLRKSLCRIHIKEVSGSVFTDDLFRLQSVSATHTPPNAQSQRTAMDLPKRTSVDIGLCKVSVNNSDLNASSLSCLLGCKDQIKLRADAKGLELKRQSETLVCVPSVDVNFGYEQGKWEATHTADFVYLAVGKSLAEFLSLCIPMRKITIRTAESAPTPTDTSWSQSISVSTIKLSLFDDEGKRELLQGEVSGVRVALTKGQSLDVAIACTTVGARDACTGVDILHVEQPDVLIQQRHVDFSCARTAAHWVKTTHETCYPSILTIIRSFTNRHRRKWKSTSPAKDVNLDFANVSVTLSFAAEESLRAEVARFQTDIIRSEKLLKLCFTKSHLYAKEVSEKLLLTCQDLAVRKTYIEKDGEIVAKIDVEATGSDVLVPDNFPWGRAVFKCVVNVIAGIRWTMSFLFPGVPRIPHIVFMEKAVTSLVLSQVRVVIADSGLQKVVRRKLQVKADAEVYPQLKAMETVGPMLELSFQLTTGEFGERYADNTRLCSAVNALSALQDMDYFEVPPESYFAFIMANDLTMTCSNSFCRLRDFPWKLYQVDILTIKGRSMITKNRLPLHNWARWKIHSNMRISLAGVTFTLGLCLRSAFLDV